MTARRPPRVIRGSSDGASALELTIVAPAVLLLIFGILQFGLWMYGRNVALQAAREGVSTLRLVQPDADLDAAERRAEDDTESFAAAVGRETLLSPTATARYDEAAGRVEVTITGETISLIGLTLTVTRTATGEVERFEADRPPP